jgi:hypothetical protein
MLGALGAVLIVAFVLIRDRLFVAGMSIAYFAAAIMQVVIAHA